MESLNTSVCLSVCLCPHVLVGLIREVIGPPRYSAVCLRRLLSENICATSCQLPVLLMESLQITVAVNKSFFLPNLVRPYNESKFKKKVCVNAK